MGSSLASGSVAERSPDTLEYTISDMASYFGVSLRTLRFYEDKGLIFPRRQGTGRYYSPKDRIRVELILKGKRMGFSLSAIRDLIESRTSGTPDDHPADLVVSLNSDQVATQIAYLERQREELSTAIDELREAHRRMSEVVD